MHTGSVYFVRHDRLHGGERVGAAAARRGNRFLLANLHADHLHLQRFDDNGLVRDETVVLPMCVFECRDDLCQRGIVDLQSSIRTCVAQAQFALDPDCLPRHDLCLHLCRAVLFQFAVNGLQLR